MALVVNPDPYLTGDGSRTLYSDRYQQTYHSHFGAETEARQVFLEPSGVAHRLRSDMPTSVLEIGFGLGLNFLITADLAESQQCNLYYTAFENNLIDSHQYRQLDYAGLLANPELATALLPVFDNKSFPTDRHLTISDFCQLALLLADVTTVDMVSERNSADIDVYRRFDAVYLDAFSPDSNPECWTLPFLQWLSSCLKPGGTLTTYSVKGSVRRALSMAGFNTQKLPGPPGKREILRAVIPH